MTRPIIRRLVAKHWPKRHYAWVPYDTLVLRVFEAERMNHSLVQSWRTAVDYAQMNIRAEWIANVMSQLGGR